MPNLPRPGTPDGYEGYTQENTLTYMDRNGLQETARSKQVALGAVVSHGYWAGSPPRGKSRFKGLDRSPRRKDLTSVACPGDR